MWVLLLSLKHLWYMSWFFSSVRPLKVEMFWINLFSIWSKIRQSIMVKGSLGLFSTPIFTCYKIIKTLTGNLNWVSYYSIVTKQCYIGVSNERRMSYLDVSMFVLTSTWDNHFQWIYLTEVHWNIETINQDITKYNPNRV